LWRDEKTVPYGAGKIIAAFKKKSKEDCVESLAQWKLSVWNVAEKKEEDIE